MGVHKYSKRYEQTKTRRHYAALQKGGNYMADWLTLQQLSEKRGIPENTLRCWKSLSYIASSTIDNVVMLDDESVTRFLNVHQINGLSEDCLENIIREKELEREAILSHLDDELFLLKSQKLYQPLFHVLIQELGQLITDDHQREIFLAISTGEPISRVSVRHQLTYAQTIVIYNSVLEELGKNTARIATYRNRVMSSQFSRFDTADPTSTPIINVLETHAYYVLREEAGINTIRGLLQYTSRHGWKSLKELRGMGTVTYNHMIDTLYNANFIAFREDGDIELSPEIAALLI